MCFITQGTDTIKMSKGQLFPLIKISIRIRLFWGTVDPVLSERFDLALVNIWGTGVHFMWMDDQIPGHGSGVITSHVTFTVTPPMSRGIHPSSLARCPIICDDAAMVPERTLGRQCGVKNQNALLSLHIFKTDSRQRVKLNKSEVFSCP